MPTPHIFPNRAVLVRALASAKLRKRAEEFFSEEVDSLEEVIRLGVASNTFRAFRNLPVRPSVTFRDWTLDYLESTLDEFARASNEKAFDAYVHSATLELGRDWLKATGAEMGYGRGAKLLNLIFKKTACYSKLTEARRQKLIPLLHVPWDSYTLLGLQNVAPELKIPGSATMKFITSPEQYLAFNKVIRSIAKEADVPPIYYDVLAWDLVH